MYTQTHVDIFGQPAQHSRGVVAFACRRFRLRTRYCACCNVTLMSPFRLLRDCRFAQMCGLANNLKDENSESFGGG